MSGEEARQAQVAEVLALHGPDGDGSQRCWCPWRLLQQGFPAHQAAMLAAAGLIAPPPPRTWHRGDPEPAGDDWVIAVMSPGHVLFLCFVLDDGTVSWGTEDESWPWADLPFPLTEVRLPHLDGVPS